jgi:hypothetical protein
VDYDISPLEIVKEYEELVLTLPIDWIFCLIYTVVDRNIAFLVPLSHVTG